LKTFKSNSENKRLSQTAPSWQKISLTNSLSGRITACFMPPLKIPCRIWQSTLSSLDWPGATLWTRIIGSPGMVADKFRMIMLLASLVTVYCRNSVAHGFPATKRTVPQDW